MGIGKIFNSLLAPQRGSFGDENACDTDSESCSCDVSGSCGSKQKGFDWSTLFLVPMVIGELRRRYGEELKVRDAGILRGEGDSLMRGGSIAEALDKYRTAAVMVEDVLQKYDDRTLSEELVYIPLLENYAVAASRAGLHEEATATYLKLARFNLALEPVSTIHKIADEAYAAGKLESGGSALMALHSAYEAAGEYSMAAACLERAAGLFEISGHNTRATHALINLGRLVLRGIETPFIWDRMKEGIPESFYTKTALFTQRISVSINEPMRAFKNILSHVLKLAADRPSDVTKQLAYYFITQPSARIDGLSQEAIARMAFIYDLVGSELQKIEPGNKHELNVAELYVKISERLARSGRLDIAEELNTFAANIFTHQGEHSRSLALTFKIWSAWNAAGNSLKATEALFKGLSIFFYAPLSERFVASALKLEVPEFHQASRLERDRAAKYFLFRIRAALSVSANMVKRIVEMDLDSGAYLKAMDATYATLGGDMSVVEMLPLSLLGGGQDVRPDVLSAMPWMRLEGTTEVKLPESLQKATERVREAREKFEVRVRDIK